MLYLPPKSLVCIAGRVIHPEPVLKTVGKDTPTLVGNAWIHYRNHTICVAAFGDRATLVQTLRVGSICYITAALTHPGITQSGRKRLELRFGLLTEIASCPEALERHVKEVTSESPDAATSLSTLAKGKARDWSAESPNWLTLSVVEAVSSSNARRDVDMVCKVPSVFVQPGGSKVCYHACTQCRKAWRIGEQASCACDSPEQGLLWKSILTLTDSTAQVTATCFDAFKGLVQHFAGEDMEKKETRYYEEPEHVEDLFHALAAVPFTVLLSFANSDYSQSIEVMVQLCSPTFHPSLGVQHQMSKLTWMQTSSFGCPPCAVPDTEFKPGVGMTMGPGGAVPSFCVLLTVQDTAPTPRKGEGPDSFRITRRCACALRSDEDARLYNLTQTGSQGAVLRLLALAKKTCIHAIVSWRSQNGLTLSNFVELPPDDLPMFKQFFRTEVKIYRDMMKNSDEALQIADDETPLRISSKASSATWASPWTSRKRLALEAFAED